MKHQHTPGPWNTGAMMTRVEMLPEGWRMPVLIADCHGKHSPGNEDERVANARLIAAAPELLAALEVLIKSYENPGLQPATLMQNALSVSRAAIAKAKGQP